jgi:sulfur-carrier protein
MLGNRIPDGTVRMARVVLASALSRWLPETGGSQSTEVVLDVPGERLDAVLDGVFARFPNLRGYVLDEHGAVRHHVAVFVDGTAIADKQHPAQPLGAASEVYLMQALSGG